MPKSHALNNWFAAAALVSSLFCERALAEGQHVNIRGKAAIARYYKDDGCSYTSVSIVATESATKSAPGAPVMLNSVHVDIFGYDFCSGAQTDISGDLMADNVATFQGNISSATVALEGSVEKRTCIWVPDPSSPKGGHFDCSVVDATAKVSLVWTGTGTTDRTNFSHKERAGAHSVRVHYVGSQRTATLSGAVMIDSLSLPLNEFYDVHLVHSMTGGIETT